MSQLFRFVHLFDHFACYGVEPKELLAQSIDELRKSPSVSDRFCIGNVVIKVIAMNSLVTRKAAGFCQSFHAWAKPKALNFLVKIVAGASGFGSKFLQTNTQERTSRSGRKVRDALSFLENGCNCFWHVFRRLYGSAVGINHFAVFPKCDFPAVSADLYEVLVRIKKLKEISWNDVGFPIGNHSYQINTLRSLVQLGNQLIDELTVVPTAWAGECF